MTRTEADGIEGFVEVDDDGRHYVDYEQVEDPYGCEMCSEEAVLIDGDDGVRVESRPLYRIKGLMHTVNLCREHLAEQPTHVAFGDPNGGGS